MVNGVTSSIALRIVLW